MYILQGHRKDLSTHRRAALIDAARSTFLHNSYERVSIRELARRANVDAAMISDKLLPFS